MDPTVPPFPDAADVARAIPRYRIVRRLAQTAMSEVYLARDTGLHDRLVAVKIPADGADPARFAREVAVAARLTHPNIIPLLADAGPTERPGYLVMPYVPGDGPGGPDLQTRLDTDGPLGLDRTLHLAAQLASALDYAHEAGVVHRDVKPRNVLLAGGTDHAYLCDFGIAKIAGEQLTVPGSAPFGTPGFSAPDPVAGRRGDVYSLGAVVYACLAGTPPFESSDTHAVRASQLSTDPPPVSARVAGLPPGLDEVVARAMARDPAQRYPSCGEFVTALRAAAAGTAGPPVPGGAGRAARGGRVAARRLGASVPVRRLGGSVPVRRAGGSVPVRRLGRLARRHRVVAGLLAVALVGVAGLGVWYGLGPRVGDRPDGAALARIPTALRADCRLAAPTGRFAAADTALTCRTGTRTVRFGLYDGKPALDAAYRSAVRAARVPSGSGDCPAGTDGEHRYPATGAGIGRVLCATGYGETTLTWTDIDARTVGTVVGGNAGALGAAWSGWVRLAAYPTAAERALTGLVALSGCRRAAAGSVDDLPGLTAAVTCDPPGDGASSVSYYQFGSDAALTAAVHRRSTAVRAPSGVDCSDGAAPGFLGVRSLDLRSVPVGQLLCHRGEHDAPVLTWSVEPLRLLATATGTKPGELARWWRGYYGFAAPTAKIAAAVNAHADPVFPTAAERALLRHVPAASRVDCMRPPHDQITSNVGDATVTAVVCGPTRGTSIVFYYQFDDAASMNAAYAANVGISGPRCTDSPADFHGDAPYRNDGARGRLGCARHAGSYTLAWTDDHLEILTLSFGATSPDVLLDWWRFDAGPR
ncbi:serine/threonine-protein kinase [Actinocatenispora comari]|uniref:serine/threonine-protein kinase n=1 Tax=Actinocatenispora comari TaxID=2807577 RepID=UPI001A916B36|nr:serine/threonine-protein kinase [Actinocatenispora comari]